MGMHIWYGLALRDATFEEAVEKLTLLRHYALDVGFTGDNGFPAVGELRIKADGGDNLETYSVTEDLGGGRQRYIAVPALQCAGFMTMPGKGTETASFVLASYPLTYRDSRKPNIWSKQTIQFDGTVVPDCAPLMEPMSEVIVGAPPGFSGKNCCKTQYANRYGRDHFMRCHLALIKLLDYAREIGILDHVIDDGEYWETRSADVLLSNLRQNDAIVAAVVGNLYDAIGNAVDDAGCALVAPITVAPDFEHLEAEGIQRIPNLPDALGSNVLQAVRNSAVVEAAPMILWPAGDSRARWPALADSIEDMQRLNSDLDLRVVHDEHGLSYLRHAGSSLDVIGITLPYRADDHLTSALTEYNTQRLRIKLNDGSFVHLDARRIERTASGSLLIRPRSWGVTRAYIRVAKELKACLGVAFNDKVYSGWCVLPENDGEEFWEFELSYWPMTHDVAIRRPDGTWRKNREYWAQLAGGLIAIRDRYDLDRTQLEARCMRAVEMGVEWCVLIDQEAHSLSVFRADGVERIFDVDDWVLRELPKVKWHQSLLSANPQRQMSDGEA